MRGDSGAAARMARYFMWPRLRLPPAIVAGSSEALARRCALSPLGYICQLRRGSAALRLLPAGDLASGRAARGVIALDMDTRRLYPDRVGRLRAQLLRHGARMDGTGRSRCCRLRLCAESLPVISCLWAHSVW